MEDTGRASHQVGAPFAGVTTTLSLSNASYLPRTVYVCGIACGMWRLQVDMCRKRMPTMSCMSVDGYALIFDIEFLIDN